MVAAAEPVKAALDGSRYLWFANPANYPVFEDALPIGNGRLGVAVYGGASEVLGINENSIWSGPLQNRTPPDALEAVPVARQMILDGEITPGNEYVMREMISNVTSPRSYSYFGNLNIDFGHLGASLTNYTRWLDTKEGTSGVNYTYNGVEFTFVSKVRIAME